MQRNPFSFLFNTPQKKPQIKVPNAQNAAKNSLKNAVKKGANSARIQKIRAEILKKTQQVRLLKKDPKNEKLIARINTNIRTLNDRIERIQNPVTPNGAMNAEFKAAFDEIPNDDLEAQVAALPDDLEAQVALPNTEMNNVNIALLSEDILAEEKHLGRLLAEGKSKEVAISQAKIKKLNEKMEKLMPANARKQKLARNVIRAKGNLNDAERNVFFTGHRVFTKPARTQKNVENARAKYEAAIKKRDLFGKLDSNLTLNEELAALETNGSPALPRTPNGSPPALPRTPNGSPPALPRTPNGSPPALPRTPNGSPPELPRTPNGSPPALPSPPNGPPGLSRRLAPRVPNLSRRKGRRIYYNNEFIRQRAKGRSQSNNKTKNPLHQDSSPNLEPNMSGMGAALMISPNEPSQVGNILNSENRTPQASHVGPNNLSELKREYLKSRTNLAEAEAKLSNVTGSYIKKKEDYLVASIQFLLLQKKYVESGGNASNSDFAAFTDPSLLNESFNGSPLTNSASSSNSPPTSNMPGQKSRFSLNPSKWLANGRNFLSRKAANYKAAHNTQKQQAAVRADLAKRDKAERDKRAAQVADAKRRQARQLAENALVEKAARDARSALARQAKAASEKASRNAERARARAAQPPKRSFDYQKSPTVFTLGQMLIS